MRAKRPRLGAAPVALPIAVLAVLALAVPASAALTASVENLEMPAVPYSHYPQTTSGRAVLTAEDSSLYALGLNLLGVGWNVTEQTSALVYSGPNQGTSIPAANLSVASVEAPVARTGSQPIHPTGGPKAAASPAGSLDTPRKVLQANSGYGAGTYTQGIALSLTIPAYTRAGTYTATLTTTISTGP
ncbi:hypothetical protein ASF98_11330 [Arthrobacter sp. Leaf337]|uniref:hypothetical protein n=1 Tax=Arthrobacter sp. Leaf337 TaxID=1736342 RepID=UPI0006FCA181|nr:hypothetical protein [Arthrobacter sp. Leaf337]KQR64097.1 hypothetical protein ASF98_11330 [Arthrobacter sp. Leaf337]